MIEDSGAKRVHCTCQIQDISLQARLRIYILYPATPIGAFDTRIDRSLEHMLKYQLNTLTLQVTQQCNLRCEYCVYSGNYKNRQHSNIWMDFETAKKCIDFVIDHSVNSEELYFSFYGGEQLLNFELIKQCVEYIRQEVIGKKIYFNITTNGTLLTNEILKFLEEEKFYVLIK